jgi:phosphopantetheinyl transferase
VNRPDLPPTLSRASEVPNVTPLRGGEVHLWSLSLEVSGAPLSDLVEVLSPAERDRGGSFRFPHDRRRFLVARARLRQALAAYTGIAARNIDLRTTPKGKPFLSLDSSPFALHFNLSHSSDRVLMAFSSYGPIGVDLEDLTHERRLTATREFICAPEEDRALDSVTEAERARALLRIWTAKEAFLKATGDGLRIDPTRLRLSPGVPYGSSDPATIHWPDHPELAAAFMIVPLPECETRFGASAAIAIRQGDLRPRLVWINPDPESAE